MSGLSKTHKPVSYYIEWGYIQGRNFTLNFLALGSMLIFYKIGSHVGEITFGQQSMGVFFTRLIFVALAYYTVDWVLKIVLTDASSVVKQSKDLFDINGNKITTKAKNMRHVWNVAIIALIITTSISLASNMLVSRDLSGDSPLVEYKNQLITAKQRTDTLKFQALQALSGAGRTEQSMTQLALRQRDSLIFVAVNSTENRSWKRDYYDYKDNPKAWFWKCTKCPIGYKSYRDRIKTAINRGDTFVSNATSYTSIITAALAPTLSADAQSDTTMMELKSVTFALEKDRESRETALNIVFLVMTLAGAVISLLLTFLLKRHREANGQLINDNPTRFLMVFNDIANRSKRLLSDVLYSLTFHQHERAIRKEYLVTYTVENDYITDDLHATVHKQKHCLYCNRPLTGKRSDAKYCDDDCRNNYHADKRKATNGVIG